MSNERLRDEFWFFVIPLIFEGLTKEVYQIFFGIKYIYFTFINE